MPYQELRKLYYGDLKVYREVYQTRFASEDCIKVGFPVGDHPAFFMETTEVLHLMLHIARMDKEILRLCKALPGVAIQQYARKCLIDEIVLTNNIEGVHSSRKEIGEALDVLDQQSQQKGPRKRFLSLVHKYQKLMEGETLALETCQDIRNIYDELFLEEIQKEDANHVPDGNLFRKDIAVVYSPAGREIHRGIYPEEKLIEAMEQALAFLHDESIEVLYRICIFHYLIEYIHPFYDGNGRLGRFVLSYYLSKTLEPLTAYRISEVIKEHRTQYYRAFVTCNDPHELGDLTPFLLMQLQMIDTAVTDLRDSLERRYIRWQRYEQEISAFLGKDFDQKQRRLYSVLNQAALFSEGGISTRELTDGLEISRYTLRNALSQIPEGWLTVRQVGREKRYELNLNALDELLLSPDRPPESQQ